MVYIGYFSHGYARFSATPSPLARYDLLMDTHPARAGVLIAPSAAASKQRKEKDASLGGVGRGKDNRIPSGASLDASNTPLGGAQPAVSDSSRDASSRVSN